MWMKCFLLKTLYALMLLENTTDYSMLLANKIYLFFKYFQGR